MYILYHIISYHIIHLLKEIDFQRFSFYVYHINVVVIKDLSLYQDGRTALMTSAEWFGVVIHNRII